MQVFILAALIGVVVAADSYKPAAYHHAPAYSAAKTYDYVSHHVDHFYFIYSIINY